jgi:hypothetical protein
MIGLKQRERKGLGIWMVLGMGWERFGVFFTLRCIMSDTASVFLVAVYYRGSLIESNDEKHENSIGFFFAYVCSTHISAARVFTSPRSAQSTGRSRRRIDCQVQYCRDNHTDTT